MKTTIVAITAFSLLAGCAAQMAAEDDAQCRSYGAHKGDQAYVQCRTMLHAARRQAGDLLP
jgi:hypothetical protein